MIVLVGLVFAALSGVPVVRLILLASAAFLPVPTLVAVVAWVLKGRTVDVGASALFCEGVASELRSGASLPSAVRNAAAAVGVIAPVADAPAGDLGEWMKTSFPDVGSELAFTYEGALRAGNDPALLFDEIGSFALARAEIDSEVRVAVAPGVATAALLIGTPLFFLVTQVQSGQLARVLATPGSGVAALLGLGLFGAGSLIAGIIVFRTRS